MLTIQFIIDDADLEAGIEQARVAYNASLVDHKDDISSNDAYAAKMGADALEAFRGSARRDLSAKVDDLSDADIAAVAADVATRIAARPRTPPITVQPADEIADISPVIEVRQP